MEDCARRVLAGVLQAPPFVLSLLSLNLCLRNTLFFLDCLNHSQFGLGGAAALDLGSLGLRPSHIDLLPPVVLVEISEVKEDLTCSVPDSTLHGTVSHSLAKTTPSVRQIVNRLSCPRKCEMASCGMGGNVGAMLVHTQDAGCTHQTAYLLHFFIHRNTPPHAMTLARESLDILVWINFPYLYAKLTEARDIPSPSSMPHSVNIHLPLIGSGAISHTSFVIY